MYFVEIKLLIVYDFFWLADRSGIGIHLLYNLVYFILVIKSGVLDDHLFLQHLLAKLAFYFGKIRTGFFIMILLFLKQILLMAKFTY